MKIIECKQHREWKYWEAHRGLPGSSCAERIITEAKGDYSTAADALISELIWQKYDPNYGMYEETATKAMRHGIACEPQARKFYEFERDCKVREVGLCLSDDGIWCCSPDGLVGDEGAVELKCPDEGKVHVKYMRNQNLLLREYKQQVHWILIVAERQWVDLMSWHEILPPVLIRVTPDAYTEKLRAHMVTFAAQYAIELAKVEAQMPVPPPPEPDKIVEYAGFGSVEIPSVASPF